MAIKIGHAAIDENGNISGGTAGDQTGKEVCIRTWYSKPWSLVLRAIDSTTAENMAKACEAGCKYANIGYDQSQRNTAHTQAKAVGYDLSKITTPCETDCSAFMTLCALCAGVSGLEYVSNAPTTSTMRTAFVATGAFEALTDSKYLTTDSYLQRGDILVAPGKHTAMALENGKLAKGSAASTETEIIGEVCNVTLNVLKSGSKGEDVRAVQRLLIAAGFSCGTAGADGEFGSGTAAAVKRYQSSHALTADGVVGSKTWSKLLGVG
jgi:hypothetical protein